MTIYAEFFMSPTYKAQIYYEALRAYYVEGISGTEVAKRFDIPYGTFKNLCYEFRKSPNALFFWTPPKSASKPAPDSLRARIVELRKTHNVSIHQIPSLLRKEGLDATPSYISKVIRAAGLPRLPTRPPSPKPAQATRADCRALNLSPHKFSTSFGGLFLFLPDLVKMEMESLVQHLPGSKFIPAPCMIRSLLALKLWGIGRHTHVMANTMDEGLALFAGLNGIPKRSTLSEYSSRCDPHFTQPFTHGWLDAAARLNAGLGRGTSFDLDFHTIPYHGDKARLEKHYISKRSRRQLGVLTFLARDANHRVFSCADTTVHKENHSLAIQNFVDDYAQRTGTKPSELVFDSGVTTYEQLGRLTQQKIHFITLRRRHKSVMDEIQNLPQSQWRAIKLTNIGRNYRTPSVLEQTVKLKGYPGKLRQIAIQGLGHDRMILLITNQMERSASQLIDRYARRMVIENVISDTIDFFHMDALSAAIPMNIHVDVQLTVIASLLYRILGLRANEQWSVAENRTLYEYIVPKRATIRLTKDEIIVKYPRRSHNPLLMGANYHKTEQPIPWLDNKILKIQFT